MKKLLLFVLMFVSCYAVAQKKSVFHNFTDATVYLTAPGGVGGEMGYWGNPYGTKKDKWGAFLGFNLDSKNQDLTLYFKGQYTLHKYVAITALGGLADLSRLATGVGIRGVYPIQKKMYLMVEPMWRNTGSRVNLGVSLDL
jgi:hypothetical protein